MFVERMKVLEYHEKFEVELTRIGTIIDKKSPPPCNHMDIRTLRLPTLARNQAGDWLMPG